MAPGTVEELSSGGGGGADPALWAAATVTAALAAYLWGMWTFDRFSGRGLPCLPALPFVGASLPFICRRKAFHTLVQRMYACGRGRPLCGLFWGRGAVLMLREPRLVRRALVEACAAFPRAPNSSPHCSHHCSLQPPLFNQQLSGTPWRQWRGTRRRLEAALGAALGAAAAPAMAARQRHEAPPPGDSFDAVSRCAQRLTEDIERSAAMRTDGLVSMRGALERFWSESLGALLFGILPSSPSSDVFHSKRMALVAAAEAPSRRLHSLFPRIAQLLGVPEVPAHVENYFRTLGREMAAEAKKNWLLTYDDDAVRLAVRSEQLLERSSALWQMLDAYLQENITGSRNGKLEWRAKADATPAVEIKPVKMKKSLLMRVVEVTLPPISEEANKATAEATRSQTQRRTQSRTEEESANNESKVEGRANGTGRDQILIPHSKHQMEMKTAPEVSIDSKNLIYSRAGNASPGERNKDKDFTSANETKEGREMEAASDLITSSSDGECVSEREWMAAAEGAARAAAAQVAEGGRRAALLVAVTLNLLAQHPEAQRRAAHEAQRTHRNHGPTPFIEALIKESLRLWPAEAVVARGCLGAGAWRGGGALGPAAATATATAVHLHPDDTLWVPIAALHTDPKHWSQPNSFVPERFLSKENTEEEGQKEVVGQGCDAEQRGVYLPFGLGPRACAGRELVLHLTKTALVALLSRLQFHVTAAAEKRRGGARVAKWRYTLELLDTDRLHVRARH